MKRVLEQALAEILPKVTGLRAVVISAAPDGLIAWCWSRDGKSDIALGFAALDRAASVCLEELGASRRSRSLLLTAHNTWVASWSMEDVSDTAELEGERLVITTVFEGELQNGMVMLYGTRVRHHLSEALKAAKVDAHQHLRASLAAYLFAQPDPSAALTEIAQSLGIESTLLANPDALDADLRQQLAALLQLPSGTTAGPQRR